MSPSPIGLFEVPETRQQEVLRILAAVWAHCQSQFSRDDALVRKVMTRHGWPGIEALPQPEGGQGTKVVASCDGTWSCVFTYSLGFPDPKQNGYQMLAIKTDDLKRLPQTLNVSLDDIFWALTFAFDLNGDELRQHGVGSARQFMHPIGN